MINYKTPNVSITPGLLLTWLELINCSELPNAKPPCNNPDWEYYISIPF